MKQRISQLAAAFDERPVTEKGVLLLVALAVSGWLLWSLLYAPAASETAALERRLATAESRLQTLMLREQTAIRASRDDPDMAARQRITRALQDQDQTRERIELLAGNLVAPATMTRLLTAILDDSTTLRLLRVENRPPQALRAAGSGEVINMPDAPDATGAMDAIDAEVYRHSLLLELEGDYLGLIAYLRRVETLGVVFFWDRLHFVQTEWPLGRVTLELHTLSAEEGFVGV